MSLAVLGRFAVIDPVACANTTNLLSTVLNIAAVYITANISGGHLNPAVTLATMVTGHIGLIKGCAYILCQLCGAIFGMLMVVSLCRAVTFMQPEVHHMAPGMLTHAAVFS